MKWGSEHIRAFKSTYSMWISKNKNRFTFLTISWQDNEKFIAYFYSMNWIFYKLFSLHFFLTTNNKARFLWIFVVVVSYSTISLSEILLHSFIKLKPPYASLLHGTEKSFTSLFRLHNSVNAFALHTHSFVRSFGRSIVVYTYVYDCMCVSVWVDVHSVHFTEINIDIIVISFYNINVYHKQTGRQTMNAEWGSEKDKWTRTCDSWMGKWL